MKGTSMSYGQQGNNKNTYSRGGNTQRANPATATTGLAGNKMKSDAILTRFLRPSKSGKSVATFSVGKEALVIPANTRVVITALSQKRMDALAKSAAEKGFEGAVPTHELVVFPITNQPK
jgi:hypothetical protein